MNFKTKLLAAQFQAELEAEVRKLLEDFDSAGARFGLPAPLVSCLGRTAEENKACGGVPNSLHLWEVGADGERLSRAADLSLRPYGSLQAGLAETWLRQETLRRGGRDRWECLRHRAPGGVPTSTLAERESLDAPPTTQHQRGNP